MGRRGITWRACLKDVEAVIGSGGIFIHNNLALALLFL